jgi:membrane protein DedA with SNARE-associated domain
MIATVTNYISHLIISLGGLGVFLASILEEIIVPIPSVLVQSGAGLFLLGGQTFALTSFFKLILLVAFPAALGVAIGSLVVYSLAYYGGMLAIKKYGKYFFINYEKLEKVRISLVAKPSLITSITILRFIPLFPNVLLTAACGLLRIPVKQYLISTFIGIFIRALYLGAIGWYTGETLVGLVGIESLLGKIGTLVLVLAGISVITSLFVSYLYKRKNKNII